ncbi:MAG: cell division protein ZapA [Deltaproteobacteria bacterium]|nr:cell division protein ZapA [Deltaproteobacteria bacterium]
MKTLVEVKILGETFTVTSEDDENHVLELANFVNQRMNRYDKKKADTNPPTPLRVAIMAALSIADEYLKGQKHSLEEKEKIERISARLLSRLEQSEQLERGKAANASDTTPARFSSLRASQE